MAQPHLVDKSVSVTNAMNASTLRSISILGEDKGLRGIGHMLNRLMHRNGLLTSNILIGGGFVDSLATRQPNVQFMFLPVLDNFDNTLSETPPEAEHGFTGKVGHLLPKARGTVELRSTNPADLSLIDP